MYVCNFSTLTVTSNPSISKAHMCVFSSYCFTSNTPISKTRVTKITVTCYLWSFAFLDAQSLLHFGINGRKYFSKIGAVIKPNPFDSMDGSYLSIIFLYFFVLLLVICCRTRMTRLILKVVIINLSIFKKKGKKLEQISTKIIILQ